MTIHEVVTVRDGHEIPATIALIGQAIETASQYPPLILHARRLASQAPPHDYLGQVQSVYEDFVNHWRYVRDPYHVETIVVSPPEIMSLTLGIQEDGSRTMGTGDCDECAVALGSLLSSIGYEIRLVTSSAPGQDNWSHVFIQANIPGYGWVTVDPVLYPDQEFGETVEASRLGYWDLKGNEQGLAGPGRLPFKVSQGFEGSLYEGERIQRFDDIHKNGELWGYAIPHLGYIGDARCFNVELGPADYIAPGKAVTPILALSPQDFEYVSTVGVPYPGMKAVGNTGYIYEWRKGPAGLGYRIGDGFRALGRALKRGAQWVADKVVGVVSWAWDKVENVFEATKFGRWVLGVKDQILDFAVEIVTPVAEMIGKWAPAVAPLAALIPGIGPAIAAGLLATGGVAKAFIKYGVPVVNTIVSIDGEDVEIPVPEFESDEQREAVIGELLADVELLEQLSDDELSALSDELLNMEIPDNNLFEVPPALEAEIVTEQLQDHAQAWRNLIDSQNAALEAQSRIAQQRADAQHRWFMSQPEVIQAHENSQASAYANQERVIEASQGAEMWAQKAREAEAQAMAQAARMYALNNPQYKEAKLNETALNLESIGFRLVIE